MFKYTLDNKRYHTLNYYTLNKYKRRMFKASVNAGFTCPNIDGTAGTGGCIYCTRGASEFTLSSDVSITEQIKKEKERIYKKWGDTGIIAYFQANTNTYAPAKELRSKYFEALNAGVDGISIATRADCLDDDILNLLEEINNITDLTVELGLQTVFDETAGIINRCHNFECFLNGYNKLKARNIRVCIHIINGLPGETYEMMMKTAEIVGSLKPDAVKIHLLHIMKGTFIAKMYEENKVNVLEKDEYVKIVSNQLTYLPETTVIERITGDGSKEGLIAPLWSLNKISVLGSIDKFMADNNLTQGDRCRD